MKSTIMITLVCFAVAISGCSKDKTYEGENSDNSGKTYEAYGHITGPDYRKCACCGGFFIEFKAKDDHGNFVDHKNNFYKIPAGSTLDITKHSFPIPVKFNYRGYESPACNVIDIEEIELDK